LIAGIVGALGALDVDTDPLDGNVLAAACLAYADDYFRADPLGLSIGYLGGNPGNGGQLQLVQLVRANAIRQQLDCLQDGLMLWPPKGSKPVINKCFSIIVPPFSSSYHSCGGYTRADFLPFGAYLGCDCELPTICCV